MVGLPLPVLLLPVLLQMLTPVEPRLLFLLGWNLQPLDLAPLRLKWWGRWQAMLLLDLSFPPWQAGWIHGHRYRHEQHGHCWPVCLATTILSVGAAFPVL